MKLAPKQAMKLLRSQKAKVKVQKQNKSPLGRRGRVKKIKAESDSARKEITMATTEEVQSAAMSALQPVSDSTGTVFTVSFVPGSPAEVKFEVKPAAPTV